MGGRQNLNCLNTQGNQRQSLDNAQKRLPFVDQVSGYFCYWNYAIFKSISAVQKRFILLIQKTFEADPKKRPRFSRDTRN